MRPTTTPAKQKQQQEEQQQEEQQHEQQHKQEEEEEEEREQEEEEETKNFVAGGRGLTTKPVLSWFCVCWIMLEYSKSLFILGSFHESLLHECLKSSLAFRKPATRPRPSPAAARAGLTASWSASMGMQASAPAELRGAMGRPSYLSAGGPKAKFVVDAGCSLLLGPA